MNLTHFSQQTKQEADALLLYGNVTEVLSKYGKVVVTGSYKYDLMYDPDIDLVVLCDNPENFKNINLETLKSSLIKIDLMILLLS